MATSQHCTVAMSQYSIVAMYIQLHPRRRFFWEPNYGSSLYYAQNEQEDEARWPTEPARRYSAIMACFCLSPSSDPYFSGSRPLRVTTKTTWKSLLSDTCWRYESLHTDICGLWYTVVIISRHSQLCTRTKGHACLAAWTFNGALHFATPHRILKGSHVLTPEENRSRLFNAARNDWSLLVQ